MAYTKQQLETLVSNLLASGQPIDAAMHREQILAVIAEIFSAQSRGDVLAGVSSTTVLNAGDSILIFRSGVAYRVPSEAFSPANIADLGGVFIADPQDGEVLVYNAIEGRWENSEVGIAFVRYDTPTQGLDPTERANVRANTQTVSKDTNDTRTGTLTNDGTVYVNGWSGNTTLRGDMIIVATNEDGTASSNMLTLANTSGGGVFVQKRGSTTIIGKGDSLTDHHILRLKGSNLALRVEVNNNGIFSELRSAAAKYLTRRDELYLVYPLNVTGAGKINNVALPDGTGMLVFSADISIVSGIVSNSLDAKEVTIWTDNPAGLTLPENDLDSDINNRFLSEFFVAYREPKTFIFKPGLNKWVQKGSGGSGVIDQPYNPDEFTINELTGFFEHVLVAVPTAGSSAFINAGAWFQYEQDNPRGGKANDLVPGFNTVFEQTEDPLNVSLRRMRAVNGAFYSVSSDGVSNYFYASVDGRNFMQGVLADNLQYYALAVAPHGTILIGARNGGAANKNIKRSTTGGASFTDSTLPNLEVTGVLHIGAGRWVASCRTGTGTRALYSIDDGATFLAATTSADNEYGDIGAGGGLVFMVAPSGVDRVQISTDRGETYLGYSPTTGRFWTRCTYFLGHIVLMRAGVSSGGYITVSADKGTSWAERLTPDDSAQTLEGFAIIGEWLYLFGANGYIIRTRDLVNKEVVSAAGVLTTNTISCMAETTIQGRSVIMAACSNGANNRIYSTLIV